MCEMGLVTLLLQLLFIFFHRPHPIQASNNNYSNNNNDHHNSNLFRLYIGAEFTGVRFADVPIDPRVQFHFILSFAIDYVTANRASPTPTNGRFRVFWDSGNLAPSQVAAVKQRHSNVRVALSLGGDTVDGKYAYFDPASVDSWVSNAVASLTHIITEYGLDGLDIDYEHFRAGPSVFAECIGRLVGTLKARKLISFASIAPFDDNGVQSHYLALWGRYGHLIDYVNFQFYAYDNTTTVSQFLSYFRQQRSNYSGGKVLASYLSDGSKGLAPGRGFFAACRQLKRERQLHGIFVWCADESKAFGFRHEKVSQQLLAGPPQRRL